MAKRKPSPASTRKAGSNSPLSEGLSDAERVIRLIEAERTQIGSEIHDGRRIVTIPRHNPVNAYTMGGIAQDAELTVEEFKKLP